MGKWQPIALVGQGTMARVYRARPVDNPHDGAAQYALKLLKPEWYRRPAAIEVMRREALVARSVSHAHVVSVLDWQLDAPPYFSVMPWINGHTLARQIEQRGKLEIATAFWIGRQIAQALQGLHTAGWLHADVKPANTLVTGEGHVVVFDLGFARPLGDATNIADRAVVGTLNYIAPEMLTSTRQADARSDFYSLGVTLYEMLTGALPFEGRNPAEIMALRRAGAADRLRCLNPLVPSAAVQLIRQLLATEPLRRPFDAAEVIARLISLEIETFGQGVIAGK